MRLDDGASGVRVLSLINQIQIFLQSRAHRGHMLLLTACGVEALLRIERVNLLSTFEHLENANIGAVIPILFLRIRLADDIVSADAHVIAEAHLLFGVLIECCTGEADEDDNDSKMNE